MCCGSQDSENNGKHSPSLCKRKSLLFAQVLLKIQPHSFFALTYGAVQGLNYVAYIYLCNLLKKVHMMISTSTWKPAWNSFFPIFQSYIALSVWVRLFFRMQRWIYHLRSSLLNCQNVISFWSIWQHLSFPRYKELFILLQCRPRHRTAFIFLSFLSGLSFE